MNIVPHHLVRLVAICAFATVPQIAPVSGSEKCATFQLAMGPTSAALKNQQGNTAKSDDAVVEPRRHTKRRAAIRLGHKPE
jgi:hypothetical protein